MRFLAASLIMAGALAASDREAGPSWYEDLDAAFARAGERGRLVLLREVACECDGKSCPAADLARRPAFLERDSTRALVSERFVLAVAHLSPRGNPAAVLHPRFLPREFAKGAVPVRTLLVTPTRFVLHRLDLCPHAADVDAELAFALRIREECFGPDWVPVAKLDERLHGFHLRHSVEPGAWHRGLPPLEAPPERGMIPWAGYNVEFSWEPDLESARALARSADRPILLFQVVGNLNKDGC